MTENRTKRKELIKSIAIIFLAVMLALTFFSKTILNWSLPEVSGQYAGYGQITSSIRGTGTVAANMGYTVNINESRTIKEVLIRKEEAVEAGQVLFTLEAGDSTELETARETLYDMEMALKLAKLDASVSSSDSIEDELKELREQLSEAKAELEKLAEQEITEAEVEAPEAQAKLAEEKAAALQEQYDDMSAGESEYESEAVKAARAQLKAAQTAYEAAKEADTAAQEAYQELNTLQSEVESLRNSITANEKKLNDLLVQQADAQTSYNYKHPMLNAYRNAKLRYDNAKTNYNHLLEQSADDAALKEAKDELTAAEEALSALTPVTKEEVDTLAEKLVTFKDDIYYTTQELTEQRTMLDFCNPEGKELFAIKMEVLEAREKAKDSADALSQAEKMQTKAQKALEAAQEADKEANKGSLTDLKKQITAAQDEAKKQNKLAAEAKTAFDEYTSKKKELESSITQLEKSIKTSEKNLETAKKQNSVESQRTAIELGKQERAVEKQRKEVEALEARQGGTEVTAKYPGVVTAVSVMAGEKVTPETTLATIGVEEKGYTLTMSVTNEQAARLSIGDKASVKNYWWGNVDVTLTSIQIDRAQQGKGKVLEFAVIGDVTDGQSLELEVGTRSTSYNTVVPNSAVREDSNGKFVLVAEARSTPLGNRYIATKAEVTVLDKDNYNSAIDIGSDYSYAYVITTSTKPIEAGMQVRLAEGI